MSQKKFTAVIIALDHNFATIIKHKNFDGYQIILPHNHTYEYTTKKNKNRLCIQKQKFCKPIPGNFVGDL